MECGFAALSFTNRHSDPDTSCKYQSYDHNQCNHLNDSHDDACLLRFDDSFIDRLRSLYNQFTKFSTLAFLDKCPLHLLSTNASMQIRR